MPKKIVDAPIGKRALTAIFDLFFAFLLGVGIFSLSSVAMTSSSDGLALKEEMVSYQLSSGLYYKDSDGNIKFYDNLISYELYEEKLIHYYTVFLQQYAPEGQKESHDIYWYNVFILGMDDELHQFTEEQLSAIPMPSKEGKSIWEYSIENNEKAYQKPAIPVLSLYNASDRSKGLSDLGKKVTLEYYYTAEKQNCYYNAGNDLYHRPYYLSVLEEYQKKSTVFPLILAISISATVFYLVLPLMFRDGQTLGKKIMHLAVIREDEYSSTRPQIVLRQLPMILLVTILFIFMPWNWAAIMSLGLLIVSYALAIFTPRQRAIHDYIAYTRVVDDKESIYHRKGEIEVEPVDPLFPSAAPAEESQAPSEETPEEPKTEEKAQD